MRIAVTDAALFLDLDGTLTPFAPTPDAVGPDPARRAVLARAEQALDGRLAIISGRAISDLDRILAGVPKALAGLHGLERRDRRGRTERAPSPPGLDLAVRRARAFVAERPGLLAEDKGLGVALHWRGAPGRGKEALAFARDLADGAGLVLQPGAMVAELRAPGPHKGDAIRAFLAEPPFAGATPLFLGDDLTDEHGFAAVAALGGAGLLVGPPRDSRAVARLADPAAVLRWIEICLNEGAFNLEHAPWAD